MTFRLYDECNSVDQFESFKLKVNAQTSFNFSFNLSIATLDMTAVIFSIRVFMARAIGERNEKLGVSISDAKSAPIPETFATHYSNAEPRGTKFFVDQNSAIIIIGEGSNRVDAVIEPQ